MSEQERERNVFLPSRRPDWGSLIRGLARDIQTGISTGREQRKAYDEQALATEKEISNYEAGQNKHYSDYVFDGIDVGRDLIYDWTQLAKSGEMTKAELKLRENNLKESLSGLSKLSTDFDSLMKQITTAQAEGKSGDLEAKLNQRIADLANITKGSEFYIDPQTGRGFIVKKDTEGNIIEKIDANRVNNPGMTKAPKADVGDFIKGVVGNYKMTSITDKFGNTIQSLSQGREEQFNLGLKSLAASALKDPRFAYSILADNGAGEETDYGYFQDYQAYFNEKDKDRIIQSRLEDAIIAKGMTTTIIKDDGTIEEIPGSEFTDEEKEQFIKDQESFLVELKEDDNGNPQPVITEELKQKVVEFIKDQAELQIPYKQKAAQVKRSSGNKDKDKDTSGEFDVLNNSIASGNWAGINSILKNSEYKVVERGGKVLIVSEKKGYSKRFSNDPNADVVVEIQNPTNFNNWTQWTTVDANELKKNLKIANKPNQGDGSGDAIFK